MVKTAKKIVLIMLCILVVLLTIYTICFVTSTVAEDDIAFYSRTEAMKNGYSSQKFVCYKDDKYTHNIFAINAFPRDYDNNVIMLYEEIGFLFFENTNRYKRVHTSNGVANKENHGVNNVMYMCKTDETVKYLNAMIFYSTNPEQITRCDYTVLTDNGEEKYSKSFGVGREIFVSIEGLDNIGCALKEIRFYDNNNELIYNYTQHLAK